ncbi:hypothetical protein, partial [Streptomyces sp. NEAU-H3]|uniref:hypothetical protein n=1 Tax=Streptomyces sp. NEAU-H3 TaxID=2720636 RepID=UPI001ADBD461
MSRSTRLALAVRVARGAGQLPAAPAHAQDHPPRALGADREPRPGPYALLVGQRPRDERPPGGERH